MSFVWARQPLGPRAAGVSGVAAPTLGGVRFTEFWRRMEERFGASYARSVAADYRIPALGSTIDEAIARGADTKQIWRAVCEEFEMPAHLR